MWAYLGGIWHENVWVTPPHHAANSGNREKQEKQITWECFSEGRWRRALRERARGDEKVWVQWGRSWWHLGKGGGVAGCVWEGMISLQAASSPLCWALATLLACVLSLHGNGGINLGRDWVGLTPLMPIQEAIIVLATTAHCHIISTLSAVNAPLLNPSDKDRRKRSQRVQEKAYAKHQSYRNVMVTSSRLGCYRQQ